MQMTRDELQQTVNDIGEVFKARQKELDLGEALGDSDLTTAQEETTEKLDALKRSVAEKIKSGGYTIVQEGGAATGADNEVTMPASIDCTCG